MDNIERAIVDSFGGPFWKLTKPQVHALGIECALWLSDVCSKFRYFRKKGQLDEDGYFYNTQEDIEKDTTIAPSKQTLIIKRLTELKILEVKKKGLPARNYYKIDFYQLLEIIGTSAQKIEELDLLNEGTSNPDNGGLYNKNKWSNENKLNETTSKEVVKGSATPDRHPSDVPPIRRRKIPLQERPLTPSKSVDQILTVWNMSGLRKHQDPKSKVYKSSANNLARLMRGTLFTNADVFHSFKDRKFTQDEIVRAIDNFKLAALNLDYEPLDKTFLKGMALNDFLYNGFAQNGNKSQFLKYLESPPKLLAQNVKPVEDKNPDYTRLLTKTYVDEVLGGVMPGNGFSSQATRNKFIHGSSMAAEFFRKNMKRMNRMFVARPKDQVELVIGALKDRFERVNPGNLCSPVTYEEILPAYLEKQAVMEVGWNGES